MKPKRTASAAQSLRPGISAKNTTCKAAAPDEHGARPKGVQQLADDDLAHRSHREHDEREPTDQCGRPGDAAQPLGEHLG